MIVRPDIRGKQARIRLTNAFGAQPVTFDGVFIALQTSGSAVLLRTSRPVTFAGKQAVTIAPGKDVIFEYNRFIRSAGIFDGVFDFDVITLDPKTGELKAEHQPNSAVGGPGDKLHPNRAGYAAMGNSIDLNMIVGK